MKYLLKIMPLVFFGAAFSLSASAATSTPRFYLQEVEPAVAGQTYSVRVLFDTDKPTNAYSVVLTYPPDTLEEIGFNNGHSMIDVWQSEPQISNGAITLVGGSLAPFQGQGGELVTLTFRALKAGPAGITFGNAEAYLADGKGTRVLPGSWNLHMLVAGEGQGAVAAAKSKTDKVPPEIKYISLIPDPFNKKQKLLSFLVTDPSGVKSTEVRTWSYFWPSGWIKADNPSAILSSAWVIDFRAIDNNNNIVERVLYDPSNVWKFLVTIIAAAAVAQLVAWYTKKRNYFSSS